MSESPNHGPQPLRALQACMACRNQKRKCDKLLPKCGLCVRTSRACSYQVRVAPSPANMEALQARLAELEDRLVSPPLPVAGPGTAVGAENHPSLAGSPWVRPSSGVPSTYATSSAAEPGPHGTSAATDTVRSLLFLDMDRFIDSRLRLAAPAVLIPTVGTC